MITYIKISATEYITIEGHTTQEIYKWLVYRIRNPESAMSDQFLVACEPAAALPSMHRHA